MKVNITAESKRIITLEEAAAARQIVRDMKQDESSPKEYLKYAAGLYGYVEEIITATAEIAKNARTWNAYSDSSGQIDIWIDGLARIIPDGESCRAYIEIGAYLSDIWSLSSDNREEIKARTYAVMFKH